MLSAILLKKSARGDPSPRDSEPPTIEGFRVNSGERVFLQVASEIRGTGNELKEKGPRKSFFPSVSKRPFDIKARTRVKKKSAVKNGSCREGVCLSLSALFTTSCTRGKCGGRKGASSRGKSWGREPKGRRPSSSPEVQGESGDHMGML